MAFNPFEFYRLAAEMLPPSDAPDEARARSCISRAYYGAFLAAREHAGIRNGTVQVHEQTIQHYVSHLPRVGNRLKDLRNSRNQADYELGQPCPRREAGEALRLAQAIFKDLGVSH